MSGAAYRDCPVCGERFHEHFYDDHWLHVCDEVQRLRKVEEAAREVREAQRIVSLTQGRAGAHASENLTRAISALSNTLELPNTDPVREGK